MNPTTQNHQPGRPPRKKQLPALSLVSYLLAFAVVGGSAVAQSLSPDPSDLWRDPILPRGLATAGTGPPSDSSCCGRSMACRLFRMPSALPTDPVGLEADIDPVPAEAAGAPNDRDSTGDGRLKIAIGTDNPFFAFRRPGDPGGVGFYRLHSQVLLFDSEKVGLSMGLRAVTPAGLEADGVADGPTVLSPHFAWFHEVGDGTAVQGFIGKNLRANSRWSDSLERQINYGVALQRPVLGTESTPGRSVHLFLEALGRYRVDGDPSQRALPNWELLPGIHWRLGETWWMSGGIMMPLNAPRPDAHLWQITCSWQF